MGKATAAARAALPFPNSAYGIFVCPNKGMAAIARDLNLRTGVNVCDCTRGLCGYCERVCIKVDFEKNRLPHRGIESASAACRSDALPTELHPCPLENVTKCDVMFWYNMLGAL